MYVWMRLLLTIALLVHGATADELLPTTMRAGALTKRPLDGRVHLEDIQEVKVEVPQPGAGEVLVKVGGSSMNPVDWKAIFTPWSSSWTFPHVFGRDCAGVVVAVGPGVSRLRVGHHVWALTSSEGCFAEYAVLQEAGTGLAPERIPLAQAAVLPLVALTGLQAFEISQDSWAGRNFTALVLGGSGGTGHVGIQLAKAQGAGKVITTCGTPNVDFCRRMGADQVIDYHRADWHALVPPRSVDVVYDTVALKGTGDQAFDVLRDGGFYVALLSQALASPQTASRRPSVHQAFFLTSITDYQHLDTLAGFVDQGKLRPVIDHVFTLSEVARAFNASMRGHSVGKVSVVPGASSSGIYV